MAGSASSGVPWSVNAVDPEAWADARDAARRSGLSVGEWLETAIREAAQPRRPAAPAPRPAGDPIERRLDDISERIEQFSRQAQEPAPARPGRGDAALLASIEALNERIDSLSREVRSNERNGPAEIRVAIQRLDDRIEHLLSRARIAEAGAAPELERKLEAISRTIDAMSRRLAEENLRHESARPVHHEHAPPATVEELDAAVADIMMRQSLLDGTPLPPRPVPRAARRAPAAPEAAPPMPAPAPDLSGLERQLKLMADEMQALRRSSLQNEAIAAVRAEVADLAARLGDLAPRRSLEAIERTVDSIALRLDRAGAAQNDEALGEVVDALHDIRTALADVRPAESFVSVEKDLHALSGKLDSLGGRGIDSAAVMRLQEQTAEIRDLLAEALPSDVLKALVEQIEVLVEKFEERRHEPDNALVDLMSAFDRRIEALSERIEAASRDAPALPALDDIRRRLDELQDAVARPAGAPDDRIEAMLQALSQKIDATEARLGDLAAIERGIADLFAQVEEARASAGDAVERAARSALRELATAQPMPAPAAVTQAPLRAPDARPETPHAGSTELHAAPMTAEPRLELRSMSSLRPLAAADADEALAPDHPLEPGSGVPRMRLQSAALRVAQSEAALAGIATPAPDPAARTSDFIAAARRAAQAANAEPAAEPARADESAGRSKIVSLFGGGRRAFLIGLTLFLLIFAALRFFDGQLPNPFRSGPSAPAPVSLAPQQPGTPAAAEEEEAKQPDAQGDASEALAGDDADALAAAPPAGVLGDGRDPHFPAAATTAPETTGSTGAQRPAAPRADADAGDASAADALPAALGPAALRAAAIAGDPAAAYEIGARYLDGRGVRADAAEAATWLERAFARGSVPAAYRLGSLHEKGLKERKNLAEALRYYRAAAEAGHVKAMHNLAVIHAEGPDGRADLAAAARWFRMAAERGVRDSQYNLGVLYARGLGVEQNFAESYRWFALAASQGDADAARKRDDVAKRLDAQTLVAARRTVQDWTPAAVEAAANEVSLRPEWEQPAAPRRRSVKK